MAARKLAKYQEMRDFARTAEPSGEAASVAPSAALRFVIQKHAASHLHFDLRLEYDGVFRSFATPKGPSSDPKDRRLAMEVEDHPLDYGDFEGTIPTGEYGGGTVMLWDRGYWAPEAGFEDVAAALDKGELKFVMEGRRMHGSWVLVRTKRDARGRASWILIKHRDAAAVDGNAEGPSDADRSIASGRTMAEIAKGADPPASPFMTLAHGESRTPAAAKRGASGKRPKAAAGSKMPAFIEPQLTATVAAPPGGEGWAHEIKFDGYRIQLRVEGGVARLLTRKGLDWTGRFPEIAASGGRLKDGVLDGEVVALDHEGSPDFAALQAALSEEKTKDLVYFAFDQMFAGKDDLRALSLIERKARLKATLRGAPANIRFVEHFHSAGDAVLRSACRMNLEGVVSKRLDAPYRSGRGGAWTKAKCRGGHEVVIGAYTTTNGAFRSLVAGVHKDGRLVHVGRVGTGFSQSVVRRILPRLKALETEASPFVDDEAANRSGDVHWLKPKLVAEITYEGFTADGRLRQAAFKGLREDKPAADVVAEAPQPAPPTPLEGLRSGGTEGAGAAPRGAARVAGVVLSHPDKVFWPDGGDDAPVTKRDLACYLEAVGDRLIAHIQGRPCSIVRMPDGLVGDQKFFQRHKGPGQSALIEAVLVQGEAKPYLQFNRVEALIAAAQVGALEFHPWNCRPYAPEEPGRLVFDLDPAPDVPFERVTAAAREIRDRLEGVGLVGFCKTTGGKGLHVVAPVEAKGVAWPAAKAFARDLCKAMAADAPDSYLIRMSKKEREGRIFLDYLRNDRTATAVAPYSPRGRPGAPVSAPLSWEQVKKGLRPERFTLRTVPTMMKRMTGWADYFDAERPLAEAIKRLGAG